VNPKQGYDVFREDDIKFKEAMLSLNESFGESNNPYNIDFENLANLKQYYGGKKRKNSKKSKKRKTNKKRKMSRRR
jgi:hypothetical protein